MALNQSIRLTEAKLERGVVSTSTFLGDKVGRVDVRAQLAACDRIGPKRMVPCRRRRGMPSKVVEIYDPLASKEFLRIVRADVVRTPVLRVLFDDGVEREVDFSPVISRSRWFKTLDLPTTFETVDVIHNGRALQWITGADYCADALRILADEQLAAKGTA